MRSRLVTLAGALLALVIIYGLFFNDQEAPPPTRPTTIESGSNGMLAVFEWLGDQGVEVVSLRERFDELKDMDDLPASGNVLLVTLPYLRPPRDKELEELSLWLEQGNTLLVSAALNDTPDWTVGSYGDFIDDLADLTGIWFTAIPGDPESNDPALVRLHDNGPGSEIYAVTPRGSHPLTAGITRLAGESDESSSAWESTASAAILVFELATLDPTGSGMIWQRTQGDGQIIVVGSGSMFTNRAIARADNRQFIANLVRLHLGERGRFLFDDVHHGVSVLYDPEAFFADDRLRDTIWFVIGFWLLYIVGSSNRLLNPKPASGGPRQTDFVDAIASFISKHSAKKDTGLWLYRSWFNDVRRRHYLPLDGQPVWDELDGLRTFDPGLLAQLKAQYARLTDGSAVDPATVHNTICRARRAMG